MEFIKKIVYGNKYSSEKYVDYLRKLGMDIGNDVSIYVPIKTFIDTQYPWMIKIGNHVRITEGVKILTHDYSWSVLKRLNIKQADIRPGAILGASGIVHIGNNVFVGMNTVICRNVTIGDNVIIGAGSIVTKNCAGGGVYAGNPAKWICSVEEYYKKRKNLQLEEAKRLAIEYNSRYGKRPSKEIFHEYFMLFKCDDEIFDNKMKLCQNYDDSIKYLTECKPKFDSFEEFIEWCFK